MANEEFIIGEEEEEKIGRRVEVVEKLWKHIIQKEDVFEPRFRLVVSQRYSLHQEMVRRRARLSRASHAGVYALYVKAYMAGVMFLVDWVNASKFKIAAARLYSSFMEEEKRNQMFPFFIGRLKEYVYKNKISYDAIVDILDVYKAASTPLAWRILSAIRSKLESMMYGVATTSNVGYRFTISSPLGAGKTTLSVISTIAALKLIDVPDHIIQEYLSLFVTNNVEDILLTLAAVEEVSERGLIVPVIIYDDAAVTLSKYQQTPVASSKSRQRMAARISELMQIAREGAGLYVFVTSDIRALLKMLRETTEYQLSGDTIKGDFLGLSETYTIWQEVGYEETIDDALVNMYMGKRGKRKEVIRKQVLLTITGTVSPPLMTPDEIYEPLMRMKRKLRRERIVEIYRSLKQQEEEEEETEDEELAEEVLEEKILSEEP